MQTLPRAMRSLGKSRLGWAVCSAVIALVVVLTGLWVGHTQLFADATSIRPQQFTELYFTKPTDLPATVVYGKQYAVSFTIVNHFKTTQTYTCDVVVQTEAAIQKLTPVSITVPAGEKAVRTFHFSTPTPNSLALIQVGLEHTNQQIQFYARP